MELMYLDTFYSMSFNFESSKATFTKKYPGQWALSENVVKRKKLFLRDEIT
jgi:hypothetical protein